MAGVGLCDRCADRGVAAITGYPELPDPPSPVDHLGGDGREHRLTYRVWRALTGHACCSRQAQRYALHPRPLDDRDYVDDYLVIERVEPGALWFEGEIGAGRGAKGGI